MTDKQIIFDDVDVKDCIAYAKSQTVYLGDTVYKQMEKVCMVKNQPCKFFDCQFKQMARELKCKEQECERLKGKVKLYEEILQRNAQGFDTGAEATEFADILQCLRNGLITEENYKLKQTLTEIKEIAETHYCFASGNCKWCANIGNCTTKQILQKISECEVGE